MKFLNRREQVFLDYNEKEIHEMVASALVVGFAFAAIFSGISGTFNFLAHASFWPSFLFMSLTAFFSLWLKTSIQKWIARVMESYVEFTFWFPGTLITFLASFLGMMLPAVGGLKISTEYAERFGRWQINLTPQQMGIISTVGVLIYAGTGMIFYFIAGITASGVSAVFLNLARLNGFLAVYSMTPAAFLDGKKILRWSWILWTVTLALLVATLLLFLGII